MKITLKKAILFACIITLFTANFTSCKKYVSKNETIVFKEEAKKWFENEIVFGEAKLLAKPFSELSKIDPVRIFARMGKLKVLLNWEDAIFYTSGNLNLFIVPVKGEKLTLENKFVAERCIVFYKEQNGKMEMNVIEIISIKQCYSDKNLEFWKTTFLNYFYKQNSSLGTSNVDICIYDKSYQFTAGYTVKNGNWKSSGVKVSILKTLSNENNINNPVSLTSNSACQLWGVWLIWRDEYGNESSRELLFTYCVYDEGFEDPTFGGVSGGDIIQGVVLSDEQKTWLVAEALSGSWNVASTERFSGINNPSQGGKQFTGVLHLGDNGYAVSENVIVTWVKQGVTTSFSAWVASSHVTGKITVIDAGSGNANPDDLVIDFLVDKNKNWAINEIW